jgi:uncharacterized protein YgiM (DUF1202 family)
MSAKFMSIWLLLVFSIFLVGCGMLAPAQIEPTAISIETISTLVSQTLAAQQSLLPPTLESLPPTENPPTPTITLTPTPSKPYIVAALDTNCRAGADPYWDVVGAFIKDTEAEVIGMWMNGAWYLIKNPNNPSLGKCWVWGSSVNRKGDWSRVPNINPPSTPTAMP